MDRPIEAVNAALIAGPRQWIPRLDGASHADGNARSAETRKKVTIDVGDPVADGYRTEVPVTWRATFIRRLFPVMTGKVELEPVDRRATRLSVCGMYELPLGRIGKLHDEALIHRVAQTTVKDLAESIAKRLELLTSS